MKVFYGAAIQSAENREKRANIHKTIIDSIKKQGFEVYTEHTTGKTYEEAIEKLEESNATIIFFKFTNNVCIGSILIST